MTRPRILGIGVALLTCAAITLFYVTRPSPLERAYSRIQLGMTSDEVEAILPPPAVEMPTDVPRIVTTLDHVGKSEPSLRRRTQIYFVTPYGLTLILDENDRVLTKTLFIFGEPTLFDRLRKWLGW